ncbi:MAG: ABC transporter permease [Bryobacteraceae bacterium]|jgi:putative ABC transport system permease protein
MIAAFFRNLLRKKHTEQELDDELRAYLELTTAENMRRGMSPEGALQKARRDLGGMEQVKESVRDVRVGVSLEILMQDIRYALRSLRKNSGFTTVAILTLALGIGANTTIFSVVNGVLLKPLPYPNPDRLVTLWETHPTWGPFLTVAPANFYDWRQQSTSFSRMAALDPYPDFILTGRGEPRRLAGAAVTADFFPLLGVHMALGRGFRATEDHAVVLSYSIWERYFGARTAIAGTGVRLNDEEYTVVGVTPRDFSLVAKTSDFQARTRFDVWTNLGLASAPAAWTRGTHPLSVFGRLKAGISLQRAQAELDGIARNLRRLYRDDNEAKGIAAVPMAEHAVSNVRTALLTLLAAVVMVLLIACANIANLLLTRAAARRKEMALRAALGASRKRLAQQLLTESAVLALLGSGFGLALTLLSVPALIAHLPADLPRIAEISVDGRVLAFTTLITLATGIVFGLVPMVQSRGVRLNGRGVSAGQSSLRGALIVGQVSLALVLLAGAGLMIKSLSALLRVSPGFQTTHILTARLSLPPRYANGYRFGTGQHRRISVFQRELADRVRAIPGVRSAGFTSYLPLAGTNNNWSFFIEGRPPNPPGVYDSTDYRPVTAGYFETIGIPIRRGRSFEARDDEDHALVVVVNEAMARQFWPNENPVGKRLKFGDEHWRTIVGIVGDVHHQGLAIAPAPEMYIPWGQVPNVEVRPTIVVRSFIEPASLTSALRKAVAEVDPEVPMDQVATMDQLVYGSVSEARFRTAVISLFALLALFVASIGVYGVMSYLVSQRTREFGIRMAVGATRGAVFALILRQGAKLAAIGIAIGLVAAALFGRLIASLLYGVKPLDAATLAGVSILLAAVALFASYVPARRAANTDPMDSLRYE